MSEHQLRGQSKIRSAFEVRPLLDQLAGKIGELHGVQLGVMHTTEGLFFINGLGEIVRDGPVHVICCSEEEIATGEFLKFFTPRAFFAALCEAFAQDYVRTTGGHQLRPKRWKRPSMRDFQRAYDRALALKENGVDMTPEKWAHVIEAAKTFVGSLNNKGWTFSGEHPDLPQDMQELGELAMAFAAAGKIAKDKDNSHWLMAKMLLLALTLLESAIDLHEPRAGKVRRA